MAATPLLYVSMGLQGLYLLSWVLVIFLGRSLRLYIVGYIGAILMVFTTIYSLVVTGYQLFSGMLGDVTHASVMAGYSLWLIGAVFTVLSITLYMFGTRMSLLLKLVVPFYFLLLFLANFFISFLPGLFGVDVYTMQAIVSIFMLGYILVVMLPVSILWRKKAMQDAELAMI